MTALQQLQADDYNAYLDAKRVCEDETLVGILNDGFACNFYVYAGDRCWIDEEEFFNSPVYDFEGGEYPF